MQVILQTGYASEQPPREMLRRLDIQGYYDKGEGVDKLMLWIDVGLKAAEAVQRLELQRLGLRRILALTPELHRVQPVDELLQGVLRQTAALLDAAPADGFIALVREHELIVRAGTGRFQPGEPIGQHLEPALLRVVTDARTDVVGVDSGLVVPLRVGGLTLGVIYLDRRFEDPRDAELLVLLANQAAVALHNANLFEMAALDPLTGVHSRRFLQLALVRELRIAHRAGTPLSLALIDLDGMKRINDGGGHLAGDAALIVVAQALSGVVRATDIVGRYGGDEFVIALPDTPASGAAIVMARLVESLKQLRIESANGPITVSASVGVATLAPENVPSLLTPEGVDGVLRALVRRADEAMYAAKRSGPQPGRTETSTPERRANGSLRR